METAATLPRPLLPLLLLSALVLGFHPAGPSSACAGDECGGLDFTAIYTGEPIANLDGGLKTGGTYISTLDLLLEADRGAFFGIPGVSALLYGLYNSGQFSEDYVGDAQGVSNIEAPDNFQLYEAWLDWAPGVGDMSVRAGLYDLNAEFDVIETAGLFINSSHGQGAEYAQSGLNGPSAYPNTSLALRFRGEFAGGAYGQAALLDGAPGDPDDPENSSSTDISLSSDEGALIAAEAGWSGGDWKKIALGVWGYTANFDTLTGTTPAGEPRQADGNAGIYGILDRNLWQGEQAALSGFLRLGYAAPRFNQFDSYVGAGASLSGFWPARAEDQVGLAVATAFTGSDFRQAQADAGFGADDYETNIELTYRAPITEWLVLQPDLQYIINPGTDPALDNALTIGLRFELLYSHAFGRSGGG
jgi:porin